MRVRWPTRAEFIAWGLRPCERDRCRILVNPAAMLNERGPTNLCRRCRKRWLDDYYRRERERGAIGGGSRQMMEKRRRGGGGA